ncbi:MAG TPA: lysozyme inhibitor LprI family protein, partial [Gemmatimonadaceae bacterium]|nr:lysozyme inhibitor LprI family protein [Gemmatimonadaceae bacterium]
VLAVSAMLLRDADAPGDRRASRASEATPRVSTGDVEFDRSGVDTGVLVDPNGSARPAQRPPQPAPPAGATNAPTVFAPPGTTPAPVATGDPCASEAAAAQQRCLRERIAETDVQLNRTYQSLFRELRTDPAQAARLRADQREWLARRDAECRSRVGQSGTWAPAFAQCVGEISSSRARELEAELARRRGGI